MVLDHAAGSIAAIVQRRHCYAALIFNMSTINVTSIAFVDQAFLSCVAAERRCAMIVHIGETHLHVLPVVRGADSSSFPEPLLDAAQVSCRGGAYINAVLKDELVYQAHVIENYTGETYGGVKTTVLIDDIKRRCGFVSKDYLDDLQSCAQSTALEMTYTLPNGDVLILAAERFRCYERLFTLNDPEALPVMLKQALNASPAYLHNELLNNIVLSGGQTLANGFADRLFKQLLSFG